MQENKQLTKANFTGVNPYCIGEAISSRLTTRGIRAAQASYERSLYPGSLLSPAYISIREKIE